MPLSRKGLPLSAGRLYRSALSRFLRRTFPLWERLGFHAVPVHYYQPIPDMRSMPDAAWKKRFEMVGVDMRDQAQLELLTQFARLYKSEYEALPFNRVERGYYINNGRFESVDGEILYCMIRHFRPRRIYEIGSGFSTHLAAMAALANENEGSPRTQIVAIEPHPYASLRQLRNVEVRQARVEEIPLDTFDALETNDILFIDSSHVIRIAGDVVREYLEILPRLNKGVLVHCHDIYLPADYPRDLVAGDRNFWTEQYLAHAFLIFNREFEIMWAGSHMNLAHRMELERAFASFVEGHFWPKSLWIRRKLG